MTKGFIFLEIIISLTLLSLLLIPFYHFTSIFAELKNKKNERIEILEEDPIKKKLVQGYSYLFTDKEFMIGSFYNIGLSLQGENSQEFLFYKSKDNIFKRDLFYLSTEISQYGECP